MPSVGKSIKGIEVSSVSYIYIKRDDNHITFSIWGHNCEHIYTFIWSVWDAMYIGLTNHRDIMKVELYENVQ